MSYELRIPKSGMGITEGTILKWHKQAGEAVSEGELVVEIEVAKAVLEVPAPSDGVLERILVGEGETVEVNRPIALIAPSLSQQ